MQPDQESNLRLAGPRMLITNSKLQINHERGAPLRCFYNHPPQISTHCLAWRTLVKARLIQINSEHHQNAQIVDRKFENVKKEMCSAEAPSSPTACECLVPLSLIREKQGQGPSELAGLGLDRVKLFPAKP